MKEHKSPETIFDITDEAFDMVDNRIDFIRSILNGCKSKKFINLKENAVKKRLEDEVEFLKDLRNLLRMQDNFIDEKTHLFVKLLMNMKDEEK